MTFRLWTRHNGAPVRITVREGKPVTLNSGGRTEEGYHYSSETYELDTIDGSRVLVLNAATESRNCDGRYSDCRTLHHVLGHGDYYVGEDGLPFARFTCLEAESRDYTAEACGY